MISILYIQKRTHRSGAFKRLEDSKYHFESLTDALEARDELEESKPNDGIEREYRVVDEDGKIYDYRYAYPCA